MIEKLTVLPSIDEDVASGSPEKADLPRQVVLGCQGMVSHLISKITNKIVCLIKVT